MKNEQAFTLIELLVVVLIIGILAAVALPQYQKAVEKSRAAQAITLVKSVHQAVQAYYVANGTYPTDFDELAVEIPWMPVPVPGVRKIGRSNGEWLIYLYISDVYGVEIVRQGGKYKGSGFDMYVTDKLDKKANQLYCIERTDSPLADEDLTFSEAAGEYCQKIWKTPSCTNPSGHARLCPML